MLRIQMVNQREECLGGEPGSERVSFVAFTAVL